MSLSTISANRTSDSLGCVDERRNASGQPWGLMTDEVAYWVA